MSWFVTVLQVYFFNHFLLFIESVHLSDNILLGMCMVVMIR